MGSKQAVFNVSQLGGELSDLLLLLLLLCGAGASLARCILTHKSHKENSVTRCGETAHDARDLPASQSFSSVKEMSSNVWIGLKQTISFSGVGF